MKFVSICAFFLFSSNLISSLVIENEEKKSIPSKLMSIIGKNGEMNDFVNLFDQATDPNCELITVILAALRNKVEPPESVTKCLTKIIADAGACKNVAECNKEAYDDWKSTAESNKVKAGCCAIWDVIYCSIKKNKDKCSGDEIDAVKKFLSDKGDEISKISGCDGYVYGSAKCHFPWWAILLIVVGALLDIGVIAFVVFRFMRR